MKYYMNNKITNSHISYIEEIQNNKHLLQKFFDQNNYKEKIDFISKNSDDLNSFFNLLTSTKSLTPLYEKNIPILGQDFSRPYFSNQNLMLFTESYKKSFLSSIIFSFTKYNSSIPSTIFINYLGDLFSLPQDFFNNKSMLNVVHNYFMQRTLSYNNRQFSKNHSPSYTKYDNSATHHSFYYQDKYTNPLSLINNNEFQKQAIEILKLIAEKDKLNILNPILNVTFLIRDGINIFHENMDDNLFNYILRNSLIFAKKYSTKREYPFIIALSTLLKQESARLNVNPISNKNLSTFDKFISHPTIKEHLDLEFKMLLKFKDTQQVNVMNNLIYSTYFTSTQLRSDFRFYLFKYQKDYYKELFNHKILYSDKSLTKNYSLTYISSFHDDYFKINLYKKPNFIASLLMYCDKKDCMKFMKNNPGLAQYLLDFRAESNRPFSKIMFKDLLYSHQKILNKKLYRNYQRIYFNTKFDFDKDFLISICQEHRTKVLLKTLSSNDKIKQVHLKKKI